MVHVSLVEYLYVHKIRHSIPLFFSGVIEHNLSI